MQSLPTPVTQAKVLNLADVASKNGSPVNKLSAENAKAVFQAELNRHVRAKQAQAQAQAKTDNQAKPDDAKKTAQQRSTVKDASDTDQTAQAGKDASNVPLDASFLADFGKQLDAARDIANQTNLTPDVNNQLPASVPADAGNNLIASLGIPAAVVSVQNVVSSGQVSPVLGADSAVLSSTDGAMQQKNLVTGFNNLAESNALPQQAVSDVGVKPQGDGLADVLAAKPDMKPVADNTELGKAITNAAKDLSAKELLVKDAMPAPVQLQAASATPAQTNNNVAAQQLASANVINVYPGKTGWDQAISQKVVWMVGAGQQSASLTLNPPDLGPLKVVINVHNDQADTTFISDNDEVRKALESGMAHLREKMSESGIQLGQANVSTSQQSQQEFQQATQGQGRVFDNAKNQESTKPVETDSHAKVNVRVSDGLVDTFA